MLDMQCSRCVMNNSSDNTITFRGKKRERICNYCTDAIKISKNVWFPNKIGEMKIKKLITKLKEENKSKEYDCLMGLSGGLDSSYLLYLGYKWGLRILCIHIDDGFDTDISKKNIKKLCDSTKVKLITIKPDEEQYNALVKAYMYAGVPNLAVPQDNILFACLYDYARKNRINTFLSGVNFSLECITQAGNTHSAYDLRNIKDIHRRFGTKPIKKLTFISDFRRFLDTNFLNIKTIAPLNFVDYTREKALKELKEFCGFEYYGSKHLENSLTAFIQLYWSVKKFGVDKRTSHLSSMIVSGQITRDEALVLLENPLYDENEMQNNINYILRKIKLSKSEFDKIMLEKPKKHSDYKVSNFDDNLKVVLEVLKDTRFKNIINKLVK